MDYLYAELNDDIKDTYFTGYLSGSSNEETIGVVVDVDNKTRQISADLSEATKELLANHGEEIERVEGKLDEEISRAENADAELSQALTEEIARAKETEEQLSSDLAGEEVARIEADNAIIERLDIAEGDIGALEDHATAVEGRLDVIEGVGEGSIKKAFQDAKDYVDALFDTQDTRDNKQDNSIAANKAAIKNEITDRKAAISNEATARENADALINEKFGAAYSKDATIASAIADAKKAGIDANTIAADNASRLDTVEPKVTTLQGIVETGANSNANLRSAITELQTLTGTDGAIRQEIAANKAAIEKEVSDRDSAILGVVADYKAVDLAIDNKIGTVPEDKTVVGMIAEAQTAAVQTAASALSAAVQTLNAKDTELAAEDARLAGLISANTAAINKEIEDRTAAVKEISDKVDVEKVSTAIAAAKSEAIAAAKSETDEQVTALTEKVNTEVTSRKSADDAINEHLGTIENTINSLETKDTELSAAIGTKLATDTFNSWKDSHENDHAKTATAITAEITTAVDSEKALREAKDSKLEGKISENTTAISNEVTARENADNAIIERLEPVEAFFKTTEGETLDGALDTLKEIQDYLNGEGEAAGGLIDRIAQAETDIDNLQEEFNTETGRVKVAEGKITALEGRVTTVESRATTLEDKVATLEAKPFDTYATKTEVNAVSERAELGITNAEAAQSAADKAQGEVDVLEEDVGMLDARTGTIETQLGGNILGKSISVSQNYHQIGSETEPGFVCQVELDKIGLVEGKSYNIAYVYDGIPHIITRTGLNTMTSGNNIKVEGAISLGSGDASEVITLDGTTNSVLLIADGAKLDLSSGSVSFVASDTEAVICYIYVGEEPKNLIITRIFETDKGCATKDELEALAKGAVATNASEIARVDGIVSTLRSEYDDTKALATDNEVAIGALDTRTSTVEGKVSALELESTKHAEKTYVEEELAKKVNNAAYTEKIAELTDSLSTHVHTLSIPSSATSTFTGEELSSTGTYTPQGNITVPELTITATPAEQSFLTSFTISLVPVDGDPDTVELVVTPVVAAVGAITASGSYAGEFSFTGTQDTVSVVGTPTGSVSTTLTATEVTTSTSKN